MDALLRHFRDKTLAWVIAVAVVCLCAFARADEPVVLIDDQLTELNISGQVRYWVDAGRGLGFEDVRALRDQQRLQAREALIEHRRGWGSAVWAVATLEYVGRKPSVSVFVSQGDPTALDVEVHALYPSGESLHSRKGAMYPWGAHTGALNAPFTYELVLRQHQPVQLYIRNVSALDSRDGFRAGLWLRSAEQVRAMVSQGAGILGVIYGTLSAFALYNLIMFVIARVRPLLLFAGQQLFIMLTLACLDGSAFYRLWPEYPVMQNSVVYLWSGLSGLFSFLIMDALCGVRQRYPRTSAVVFAVLAAYSALSVVGVLLDDLGGKLLVGRISNLLAGVQLLLMLVLSVRLLRERVQYALPLFSCQLLFLLGVTSTLVSNDVLSPGSRLLSLFGMHFGALFQAILQSTVLAQKIRLDERKLQDTLRVSLRAFQQANALKQQFLTAISHEFRTPISGIQGSLEILAEREDEESRGWINAASTSTRRITRLVDDIMLFTDLQSGQLQAQPVETTLSGLLRDFRQYAAGHCVEGERRLRCALEGPAMALRVDARLLQEALRQLLDNSFKYSSDPQVEARWRLDQAEGWLHVVLADNGPGLSEDLSRLFSAFSQGEAGFSRRHEGLGLGLSIAQGVVEAMGGRLNVSSRAEAGTRMEIAVPVEVLGPEPAPAPERAASGRPLNILVVEDNPVNQAIMARQLSRQGHRVMLAGNGEQALASLREASFDCILMDCQMPVMDGFEATRRIRALETPGRHTPIIAVTANALQRDRQQARECGMDDFLGKPYSGDELLALIMKHVPV